MPTWSRLPAAVAVPILLLTGCGGDDSRTVKTPQGEVKVDRDGDEVTVENDDGSFKVGGDLADGFPSEEIPLIEGKLVSSAKVDNADTVGFTAMIQPEGSAQEVAAEIKRQLTGAGFTAEESAQMGQMSVSGYENATWRIQLQIVEANGEVIASYTIVRR